MLTELNISGHRQHGKTYLLEHVATDELRQGRRVLYLATSGAIARNTFFRILSRLERIGEVRKSSLSSGGERIEHERGGVVWFRTVRGAGGRGLPVDTVIADGVDEFPSNWREVAAPSLLGSTRPRLFTAEVTTE